MKTHLLALSIGLLFSCVPGQGPQGPAGPDGPQGPIGLPGPAGGGFVAATDAAIWVGGSAGDNLSIVEIDLSMRAGLPAAARTVLVQIDVCRESGLGGGSGIAGMLVGFPTIDPTYFGLQPTLPCGTAPSTGRPTAYTSSQIWIALPASQKFEIGTQSIAVGTTGDFKRRVTLRGWMAP